jgi:hypothetical protein
LSSHPTPTVLLFELRAYTFSHSLRPFLEGVFQIGSLKLFAQVGFKSQSS